MEDICGFTDPHIQLNTYSLLDMSEKSNYRGILKIDSSQVDRWSSTESWKVGSRGFVGYSHLRRRKMAFSPGAIGTVASILT